MTPPCPADASHLSGTDDQSLQVTAQLVDQPPSALDVGALGVDELLTTTRAVRRQLDHDRPVDLAVVRECLGLALQAPSGGNKQAWRWLVISDPAIRKQVAAIYRAAAVEPFRAAIEAARSAAERRTYEGALYLAETLHRVPIVVVACQLGAPDLSSNHEAAAFYGSVLPAVWSLQLALHSRGLGSAWTTVHLRREQEMAELLGIPDEVSQVALLPVAHTRKDRFRPAARQPLDEVAFLDRWGGPFGAR